VLKAGERWPAERAAGNEKRKDDTDEERRRIMTTTRKRIVRHCRRRCRRRCRDCCCYHYRLSRPPRQLRRYCL
jgi:hypothetical protein